MTRGGGSGLVKGIKWHRGVDQRGSYDGYGWHKLLRQGEWAQRWNNPID